MSDTLAEICANKREHVAAAKRLRPLAGIEVAARAAPNPRGFARALGARAADGPALICEIKKASPSKGLIRADFDPAALACAYRDGGAACLSVLTDTPWFMGRDEDLVAARAAVELPVLRKDFILDPYQIAEARALGADCVLLILAVLDDAMARDLAETAKGWSMDVLVEVHDAAELERALALPGDLIGINNRNLKTLEVSLDTTLALAPRVTDGRPVVAESGLASADDLARLTAIGVRRFLIGESLMRRQDVAAAARRLTQGAAA